MQSGSTYTVSKLLGPTSSFENVSLLFIFMAPPKDNIQVVTALVVLCFMHSECNQYIRRKCPDIRNQSRLPTNRTIQF